MDNYFEIGKIVNTQGVKGDVRVVPSTDDIKRFELLKKAKLYKKNEIKELEIEKVWYHKKFVILKFKGVNSMNDAELLRDFVLRVDDDESISLDDDEYFIRDLIGVNVILEDNSKVGVIKDVIRTGANDVYVLTNLMSDEENPKDILIPAIKQCIVDVNIKDKFMVVKLLKGLVD